MLDGIRQVRRYELKYLITEEKARGIRRFLHGICDPDQHVDPRTGTYTVNNIYFDTPSLRFYHDTRFRRLTRFKPRIRYYGQGRPGHVFPELKWRSGSIIWKIRYPLPVEEWPTLFEPSLSDRREPMIRSGYETFDEMIHLFGAQPILHVRYVREPYVTTLENYGRITFDRWISSRLAHGSTELDPGGDYLFFDDAQTSKSGDSMVLLEIKVETMVPWWVLTIIREFNLVQTGFSKYCVGLEKHLGYRVTDRSSAFPATRTRFAALWNS